MKNLIVSLLLSLVTSFSFGQSKEMKERKLMKQNVVKAVDYLTASLKLDAKQKSICMNAFSEYGDNIYKAKQKVNDKISKKTPNKDRNELAAKREMQAHVLRFVAKRNKMIQSCLKERQLKKFNQIVHNINPHTLEVRPKKKKK